MYPWVDYAGMTSSHPGYLIPALFLAVALALCATVLICSDCSQADVELEIDGEGHMTLTGSGTFTDNPYAGSPIHGRPRWCGTGPAEASLR